MQLFSSSGAASLHSVPAAGHGRETDAQHSFSDLQSSRGTGTGPSGLSHDDMEEKYRS
jgi:hypothetical protein